MTIYEACVNAAKAATKDTQLLRQVMSERERTKMVNLTHEQLHAMLVDVKVGQVWKCIEDNRVVMVSLVKPSEIRGYMFTGFEVVPYINMVPIDFVRYFKMIHDPRGTK